MMLILLIERNKCQEARTSRLLAAETHLHCPPGLLESPKKLNSLELEEKLQHLDEL